MRSIMLTPEDDRFHLVAENDLTVTQVRAIVKLSCSEPEPLPGGRIAERIGASPAAVSRALEDLVQKGLVSRRESSEDRRVRLFTVTASGAELAAELFALRRAQIDSFLGGLEPADRARLEAALEPLAASGRLGVACAEASS